MVTNLPIESVAADMERIFKPLGERAQGASLPDRGGPRLRRKTATGGWKPLTLVAPVLVVFASVALAISYARQDRHITPSAPATTAPPVSRTPPQPVAIPVPDPVQSTSAPPPAPLSSGAASAEAAKRGVTYPRFAPYPVAPPGERVSAATRRPLDLLPRSAVATRRSSTPRRQRLAITDSATGTISSSQEAALVQPVSHCQPGSLEDGCIYQDVLNADARLRLAYKHAEQSGVASSRLAGISKRWRRAREHALDDPDGTIRSYDQLANTLDEERRGGTGQ